MILERHHWLHEWKKTISYSLYFWYVATNRSSFLKFSYSACFLRVIMKKQFCVLKLYVGTGQVVLPFQKTTTLQLCWSICQVSQGSGIHFSHRHRKTWGKGRHTGLQSFPCYDFGQGLGSCWLRIDKHQVCDATKGVIYLDFTLCRLDLVPIPISPTHLNSGGGMPVI